eukprot:NODE_2782_length_868_cov_100.050061_g2295_i0.p1 GENE.NODE_2782_length_868_cov_100.050061_g2295_i0~~NODE_2782_length_868_cov_100.050061_g2295_i0.p1  ORF type:complete len:253 (+),score=32.44 NODE_2782_length_868_cov_100.050061_g2295_i0:47-805(+)
MELFPEDDDHPTQCKVPHLHWSHYGAWQSMDWRSVRRGKEVYEQVMAPCHSLSYTKFRDFETFMSKEEVKEMAANFTVMGDPDDEGNTEERPCIRTDHIPKPYPNEKAARFANNGALPPDLNIIIDARHGGCDYVYSLLTSYHREPAPGLNFGTGQYYNPYFPGGIIGMPPPLADDMIEYEDGTPASVPQMAKDITIFLFWTSCPWYDDKKRLLWKIGATASVMCVGALWYNRYIMSLSRARRITFRPQRWV